MESKKEIKPYLEYTNGTGKQVFNEGDHIICQVKDGKRYIGRIFAFGSYRESEDTEPEYIIYLNTSQNRMSYSGEMIKVADITYACKNPVNDILDYPHIDEKQDQSRFINMIVALGHDKEKAESMYKSMKELIALYNIPFSSVLSEVIRDVDLNKDGWCQGELIEIYSKLISTTVQVFQNSTDTLRKSVENAIASQSNQ